MGWVFDALLAVGLLWLGWRTIASPSLFKAVVLFIVLGLFMALCWARLGAPDVALAEAAIGTGLTGALLLDAYRTLLAGNRQLEDRILERRPQTTASHLVLALLSIGLVGGLGWVLLVLPEPAIDLGTLVQLQLDESGVSHPVTAVLLNFRSYDTLLEIAVLLLALLGVCTVQGGTVTAPETHSGLVYDSILVGALIRLLVPLTILIAGYLLWAGAHAPGGAFQAGAVLAAVGVLLRLTGRIQPAPAATTLLRLLVVLGLGVFSTVAVGVLAFGNLLEYPRAWAGPLIVTIEACLTVSIALTLTLLFSGAPGLQRRRP